MRSSSASIAIIITALAMPALAGCFAAPVSGAGATPSASAEPSPSASSILPPGADPTPTDGPLEPAPLPTQEAPLDQPIAFDTGVTLRIDTVEAIEVTAETPGEVSGSAVRVTVTATNDSTEDQTVESAVVSVVAADGALGIGTSAGEPDPFAGAIAPGDAKTASYVFMLDEAAGRDVVVSVNYAAGEPVAVFTGKVS
ncbi:MULTISPECIES: hypothetical protein [Microbacterium]|uniref:hypothetical protein n=1 Tax=Microbacterium TaxID=33882 RepID=UPI0022F0FD33|nr:hypothetical protein [Streptomyces sp. MS2A]